MTVPKIVTPRRTVDEGRPITAIRHTSVLTEDGESLELDTYIRERFPHEPPTIFVKQNIAEFVATLDEQFKDDPRWQWKASTKEREIYAPGRDKVAASVSTVIHFFGWQKGKGNSKSVYHVALDPVTFYGRSLDQVFPGTEPKIVRLLKWAQTLRNWCRENNLYVKPTNGGIASLLLRDPRFYPDARRKVPGAINARGRDNLPGNHYNLCVTPDPSREYQAVYLDQRRAHHYHAEHTALPDSNSLFAYGRFVNLDGYCYHNVVSDFHGLYCLDLCAPEDHAALAHSPFSKQAAKAGKEPFTAFVYSNEIPLLSDLGFTVQGVRAAWGSKHRDEGVPRYAQWCNSQLDKHSDAAWLKPILLCTYGILAVRPRDMAFVYKKAKRGEPVSLFAGHKKLHGLLVGATGKGRQLEPAICNVIQRGMIEAATRTESLGLAHYLDYCGLSVLSIYADAVLVEDEGNTTLPVLPEPWRRKDTLHHLKFINTQAFVSAEMTKLPGVIGREIIKFGRGGHKGVPVKPYFEAMTGRELTQKEMQARNLKQRRI